MARWLWQPEGLSIDTFLANDDLRTGYHLLRWREEGDPELADPCRRLLDRQLLRAVDVGELSSTERLELLARTRGLAESAGLAAEGCCGLHQRQSRGYLAYKGGLRLWDGVRLQALEQRSTLVRSLSEQVEMAWLIHPAEVTDAVKRLLAAREAEARRPDQT
jgi:hypothetical protein